MNTKEKLLDCAERFDAQGRFTERDWLVDAAETLEEAEARARELIAELASERESSAYRETQLELTQSALTQTQQRVRELEAERDQARAMAMQCAKTRAEYQTEREEARERVRELEALAADANWVPLAERKPLPGQGVLLLGVYASGEDFFYHPCTWPPDMGDALDDCTHWMRIPARPGALTAEDLADARAALARPDVQAALEKLRDPPAGQAGEPCPYGYCAQCGTPCGVPSHHQGCGVVDGRAVNHSLECMKRNSGSAGR